MAGGLGQLEWSAEAIRQGTDLSGLLYPPEPGLIEARSRDFFGLHGFFADSLPDGWGQLLMDRRAARHGVRPETLTAIDRLAIVGSHGRGALVYSPASAPPDAVATLDLDALAAEAETVLSGEDGEFGDTLAALGGTSGGARPKIHVGLSDDDQICVGDGDLPPGFESWIVKFRAREDLDDAGVMEEAYARMARAAGLVMTESRLLPSASGSGYFATRRFDRPAHGLRTHVVSLSGAIEAGWRAPSIDYDMFLRATMAITRHADDLSAAFARMVFNILSSNRDDHTRQHSFLLTPEGWRLAPVYDLTFSSGPGGEHCMAVEGEGRRPTREGVAAIGRRHGFSHASVNETIDRTRAAVSQWPVMARSLGARKRTEQDIHDAHQAAWSAFIR